jgi:hypothetical protein
MAMLNNYATGRLSARSAHAARTRNRYRQVPVGELGFDRLHLPEQQVPASMLQAAPGAPHTAHFWSSPPREQHCTPLAYGSPPFRQDVKSVTHAVPTSLLPGVKHVGLHTRLRQAALPLVGASVHWVWQLPQCFGSFAKFVHVPLHLSGTRTGQSLAQPKMPASFAKQTWRFVHFTGFGKIAQVPQLALVETSPSQPFFSSPSQSLRPLAQASTLHVPPPHLNDSTKGWLAHPSHLSTLQPYAGSSFRTQMPPQSFSSTTLHGFPASTLLPASVPESLAGGVTVSPTHANMSVRLTASPSPP